jgi:hypothetical protein
MTSLFQTVNDIHVRVFMQKQSCTCHYFLPVVFLTTVDLDKNNLFTSTVEITLRLFVCYESVF